jgi:hypothetical protein
MTERVLPLTAEYRYHFVDHIGFGTCDSCGQEGPRNKLCLHCCVSEGMILGVCFVCLHKGRVWDGCEWCDSGQYMAPVFGMCTSCEYRGPSGEVCQCDDGVYDVAVAVQYAGQKMVPIVGMCPECKSRGPSERRCDCGDGVYDVTAAVKFDDKGQD